MKFPFPLLNGLQDAQQNFEQLESLDILDQTAESVLQLAVTGTKRKLAFGTTTINFPASANATDLAVTHGLGGTPAVVFITQLQSASLGQLITYNVSAMTSTTFTVQGRSSVSVNGNVTLGWIAVG